MSPYFLKLFTKLDATLTHVAGEVAAEILATIFSAFCAARSAEAVTVFICRITFIRRMVNTIAKIKNIAKNTDKIMTRTCAQSMIGPQSFIL